MSAIWFCPKCWIGVDMDCAPLHCCSPEDLTRAEDQKRYLDNILEQSGKYDRNYVVGGPKKTTRT